MYGAVHIPELPLQALLYRQPALRRAVDGGAPLAVLDESGGRSRVVSVNRVARAAGVERGSRPPQALARCGDLRLFPRQPEAEAAVERRLLLTARGLCPVVEATAAGRVTLDLRGAGGRERCAAGLEGLCRRGAAAGLVLRAGLAATPDHAAWAARKGRPLYVAEDVDALLAGLPLEAAGFTAAQAEVLAGWGVRTPAAFRKLPPGAVARRLGRAGVEALARLNGTHCRLLRPADAVPCFERTETFEVGVASVEALFFVLRRQVSELVPELEAAHRAAAVVELSLAQESGRPCRRVLALPEPSAREATLDRILSSVLETMRTDSPVCALTVRLRTCPAQARQGELFSVVPRDTVGFARTADRLAALVGAERVGSPRVADTWRPGAFRMVPLKEAETVAAVEAEEAPPRRGPPWRCLRPPRRILVWCAEGTPAVVEHGGVSSPVRVCRGPWTTSGEWWTASPWDREAWDVELEGGGLCRVYREGGEWFMEGVYG